MKLTNKFKKKLNKIMNNLLKVLGVYHIIVSILMLLGCYELNMFGQISYTVMFAIICLFGEFNLEINNN